MSIKITQPEEYISRKMAGTPHLFYFESICRKNIAAIDSGLRPVLGRRYSVHFAIKSCYHLPLLGMMRKNGVNAEVMTLLEWRLARKAGFSGHRIICNGLGHPPGLFSEIISGGSAVNIDSYDDFQALTLAAHKLNRRAEIGLRLKVDLHQFDTPYSTLRNKLGLMPFSPEFNAILSACERNDLIKLSTLHVNLAVNAKKPDIYLHALDKISRVTRRLHKDFRNIRISKIDIGGGFDTGGKRDLSWKLFFRAIAEGFERRFPGSELLIEPGRYLVNNAGFVAASVSAVKAVCDHHYIVSDATTNVLIPLDTASYKLISPRPIAASKNRSRGFSCSIVDGITSPHNIVMADVWIKKLPRRGDRIILGNCGGYTSVLGEFWGYEPFPCTLVYTNGTAEHMLSEKAIAAARKHLLNI